MNSSLVRVLAVAVPCLTVPSLSIQAGSDQAQVMVLGTFHFANPGLDLINTSIDDVLAPERQAQIQSVAEALAEFDPTKIVLELPPADQTAFNERYRSYLEGEVELGPNEHDQLGIRLAEMLGHERLFGIDVRADLDLAAAIRGAQERGQDGLAQRVGELIGDMEAGVADAHGSERTIAELLRIHNGAGDLLDQAVGDAFYLTLVEVGSDEEPLGADVVADWYRRNLRIFGNLLRLVDSERERVLVIYGSGHRSLFELFLQQHPRVRSVSALDYLPQR